VDLRKKYRPVQLDDVVGQRRVTATLKAASQNNGFASAYFFSGNRGSGKTSSARILASLLTCESVQDGKVCGECRACQLIHAGHSLDVKEVDGATKKGIADINSLKEAAYYAPNELSRRVIIIDECHKLSADANASLLKILEEPPSHLYFILCTTEPRKVLDTILSRCHRFDFVKIQSKEIAKRLKFIAGEEGITIEDAALLSVAKLARGSMRDAIGYLEMIATVANGKSIADKAVQKYFCLPDRRGVINIVKAITDYNLPLIMDQVNDMIMASVDVEMILYEITEVFRSIMVLQAQNGSSKLLDLPDNEIEDLRSLSEAMPMSSPLKLARLFSEIEIKIKTNINARWIMEASLIDCAATLRKQRKE